MKNEIFDNMLSRYDLTTEQQKRNAIFEVNQQVILAGLYAGGFFESAAFYGGTCLRIFHGLQRFSEDMDFSLLTQDDGTEAIASAIFIYDPLFYTSRLVCRQDARTGLSCMEE